MKVHRYQYYYWMAPMWLLVLELLGELVYHSVWPW
jgi:hypothetical protein